MDCSLPGSSVHRQEDWVGFHFLLQGELPDPGIEFESPALAGGFFTAEPQGKPQLINELNKIVDFIHFLFYEIHDFTFLENY